MLTSASYFLFVVSVQQHIKPLASTTYSGLQGAWGNLIKYDRKTAGICCLSKQKMVRFTLRDEKLLSKLLYNTVVWEIYSNEGMFTLCRIHGMMGIIRPSKAIIASL